MSTSTSDGDQCPVCGHSFDQQLVVERGDTWGDLFGGMPLSFFRRYDRRCSSQIDVAADTTHGNDKRVVYFHDQQSRPGFR